MKENWYAFMVAICTDATVEEAIRIMEGRSNGKKITPAKPKYAVFSKDEVEKMVQLKKNMSYKQVAAIYKTVDRNIYNHIKRYHPELIKAGAWTGVKTTSNNNYLFPN